MLLRTSSPTTTSDENYLFLTRTLSEERLEDFRNQEFEYSLLRDGVTGSLCFESYL